MCIKCAHYFFDIVIDHFCRTYKPKTVLKTGLKGYLMYVLVYSNYFLVSLNKRNIVCTENFQRSMHLTNELFKCMLKKSMHPLNIVLSNAIKKWKDYNLLHFLLDKFLKCFECKYYLCKINACFVFFYFLSLWYIDIQSHVTRGHIHLIGSGDNLDCL